MAALLAAQGDTAAASFVASYDVEEVVDAPASAVDCLPSGGTGLNSHSPFLATVGAVRELHTGGDRSCVHVELDIAGCKATYEAGACRSVGPGSKQQAVRWGRQRPPEEARRGKARG